MKPESIPLSTPDGEIRTYACSMCPPRALHALLLRAHEDGRAALAREQAEALAAVGPIAPHPDMLREFSEPDLHAELARRANIRKRKLFGGMP